MLLNGKLPYFVVYEHLNYRQAYFLNSYVKIVMLWYSKDLSLYVALYGNYSFCVNLRLKITTNWLCRKKIKKLWKVLLRRNYQFPFISYYCHTLFMVFYLTHSRNNFSIIHKNFCNSNYCYYFIIKNFFSI